MARSLGLDVCVSPGEEIGGAAALVRLIQDTRADAIYPAVEPLVVAGAMAAAEMGAFGLTPAAAPLTCDKAAMRRAFDIQGIPHPRWREARTHEEAIRGAADLAMPVVVKPTDATGSKGLSRLDHAADLPLLFRQAMRHSTQGVVLLEEWQDGPEWNVDLVITGDKAVAVAVTGKLISPPPSCVTTAVFAPGLPEGAKRERVTEYAIDVARALGIHNGIVHVQVKECAEGLCAVDVAGYPSTLGYDGSVLAGIERNGLRVCIGDSPQPENESPCAIVWIPSRSGVVQAIEGIDAARRIPGVVDVRFGAKPGDIMGHVVDRETRDRVGYVAARGETAEEALDRARRAAECCKVVTSPTL